MGSGTTPVRSLPYPLESDTPDAAADLHALALALDNDTQLTSGVLASRPSAPIVGYMYYATDKAQLYMSNGSAWVLISGPGAWQALSLGSGVTAGSGYYTPSARLEGNDVVHLKGVLQGGSGNGSTTWATIPSGLRPASIVSASSADPNGIMNAPQALKISTAGLITVATSSATSPLQASLDGIVFSLS